MADSKIQDAELDDKEEDKHAKDATKDAVSKDDTKSVCFWCYGNVLDLESDMLELYICPHCKQLLHADCYKQILHQIVLDTNKSKIVPRRTLLCTC